MRNHVAWPAAVALLIGACAPESSSPALTPDTMDTAMNEPDSLQLTSQVPPRATAGEAVTLTLEVRNASDRPLDLYLRGREPVAEVRIRDAAGAVVWWNLEGVAVPAILQLRPLAPGESFSIVERWRRAGAPGRYTVEAALLTETGTLAFPPARFEVN